MNKWPKVIPAMLVTLLVVGCASGPTFREMSANLADTSPEMGRIYFYRTAVLGAAVQPQILLNGQTVGKAVPPGSSMWTVLQGTMR